MIKDFPNIKNKNERTRFKSKSAEERAMVATSSDKNSFRSESKDKEIANICLMDGERLRENGESEHVTL